MSVFLTGIKTTASKVPFSLKGGGGRPITSKAYALALKHLPSFSSTERAALESGTIGFDRKIYTGYPTLKGLMSYALPSLSASEKKFIKEKVRPLCEAICDDEVMRRQDLSKATWDFMRCEKFFGLFLEKEYGGHQFTPHGVSQIVQMVSSRSGSAGSTVMVPNSLGPWELLKHYGTPEQKAHYLPKLASGEHIPCFALTGEHSGSDAANMYDTGVVCRENGELSIRLNFRKRYITLAPIATLIGLAVDLKDPERLLKKGEEGITVLLLEKGLEGLEIGRRHDPLSAAFMNGPIRGEDLYVPISNIIGGEINGGKGWRMLMECLAAGRGWGLPSAAAASAQQACVTVGAYSRMRRQFNTAIGDMEGNQEKLAEMGGITYKIKAGQALMNAMLLEESPSVLTAVMKQQTTEGMRSVVTHGMDILGGMGICKGPDNFMANTYQQTPVAITVEGANTLTRSLIIFGQGKLRSDPHLYKLVESLREKKGPKAFREALLEMVKHTATNGVRAPLLALIRIRSQKESLLYYESQLARLACSFSFCSDLALTLGGKLKFAEMISGRFADLFSNLYFGYALLWFHQQQPNRKELDPVLIYTNGHLTLSDGVFLF